MKEFTDTEMLDWIERQTNGDGWLARQSGTGRGFRIHNQSSDAPYGAHPYRTYPYPTAREAILHAMNKETNGLSVLS